MVSHSSVFKLPEVFDVIPILHWSVISSSFPTLFVWFILHFHFWLWQPLWTPLSFNHDPFSLLTALSLVVSLFISFCHHFTLIWVFFVIALLHLVAFLWASCYHCHLYSILPVVMLISWSSNLQSYLSCCLRHLCYTHMDFFLLTQHTNGYLFYA